MATFPAFAALIAVCNGVSPQGEADVVLLAGPCAVVWWVRRFAFWRRYRRFTRTPSDSFGSVVVSAKRYHRLTRIFAAGEVVMRLPSEAPRPLARVLLVHGQDPTKFCAGDLLRVRGSERGVGPTMLEHADRTVALHGYARQFDPDAATLREKLHRAGWVLVRSVASVIPIAGAAARSLGHKAVGVIRRCGRSLARAPHLPSLLCSAGVHLLYGAGRVAIAFVQHARRAATSLPGALVWLASGVTRSARRMPHLLRVTSTVLRLFAAAWGRSMLHALVALARAARRGAGVARTFPAMVRRSALAASALGRRACRAVRPTALRLYVGLPVLVALLAGLSAGSAGETMRPDNLARTTVVLLASALCAVALAFSAGRAVALTAYVRRISTQSSGTPGRVLLLESERGLRRIHSSGRLTVETISGADRRLVVVALLGGQHTGTLRRGVTVQLRGQLTQRPSLIALTAGDGSALAGRAELYGPMRVNAPDVVNRFRVMLRRRLTAPIATTVVALLIVAFLLVMGGSVQRIALIPGAVALVAMAWLLLSALRVRGFRLLLRRGCEVSEARVVGTVHQPWFSGWAKGGTVWLLAHGSTEGSPLEVRLIAGKRAITAQPGDAVDVYTAGGGHAPVLVVGTGPESSLIGWATSIAAMGMTTTVTSTGPGYPVATRRPGLDET
jgi:hypothetical protein